MRSIATQPGTAARVPTKQASDARLERARKSFQPTPDCQANQLLKSKKEKPVTLARDNERTNHRCAPGATWATARRLPDFSAAALGWKIESFQTASENGFPKPLARARRQASLRSQIGYASV